MSGEKDENITIDNDDEESGDTDFLVNNKDKSEKPNVEYMELEIEDEDITYITIEERSNRKRAILLGCTALMIGCGVIGIITALGLLAYSLLGSSDNSMSPPVSNDSVDGISNDSIHTISYDSGSEPYYPPVPSNLINCLEYNTQFPEGSYVQSGTYGDFGCIGQVGNETQVMPCPTTFNSGDTACFVPTHVDQTIGLGYDILDHKGDYVSHLELSLDVKNQEGFVINNPGEFSGDITNPEPNPNDQPGYFQTVTAFFSSNKRFVAAENTMYEAANAATQAGNPYLSMALLAGVYGLKVVAPLVSQAFQAVVNNSPRMTEINESATPQNSFS